MRHRVESVVCDHVRRRDMPLWSAAECRHLVNVAVADVTVGPCYFAYVCRRRHRDIAFSHECAVCKLTFIECLQYTVDTVRSLFVGHFLWSFAAAAAARHLAGISVTCWWHSVESGTDCSVTLDSET